MLSGWLERTLVCRCNNSTQQRRERFVLSSAESTRIAVDEYPSTRNRECERGAAEKARSEFDISVAGQIGARFQQLTMERSCSWPISHSRLEKLWIQILGPIRSESTTAGRIIVNPFVTEHDFALKVCALIESVIRSEIESFSLATFWHGPRIVLEE